VENDCTVVIAKDERPFKDEHHFNQLTWKQLHAANYQFAGPFTLVLADGELLFAEKVVRIIPKKRLVVFATWQGKSVVAKLFFHAHHAKRNMEDEIRGVKTLQTRHVPTPQLLYEGRCSDKHMYVLMFERIFTTKDLIMPWELPSNSKLNMAEYIPYLQAIVVELATQHVLGIVQHDLHMKNFLLVEEDIDAIIHVYTLDGAQIETFPCLLPRKQSIDNLALLLAQLGAGVATYQEQLFRHYAKLRGWLIKPRDIKELFLCIKKWNQLRWQDYKKKIFREATRFMVIRHWRITGMVARAYASPELLALLNNPDAIFTHPEAVTLPSNRAETSAKITLDQCEMVVKRYNNQNIWHYFRHCLQQTYAWHSWVTAQKMRLFGVPCAKPIAFIEKRFFGLRGSSYYISENAE
jgi:hypothetical protein